MSNRGRRLSGSKAPVSAQNSQSAASNTEEVSDMSYLDELFNTFNTAQARESVHAENEDEGEGSMLPPADLSEYADLIELLDEQQKLESMASINELQQFQIRGANSSGSYESDSIPLIEPTDWCLQRGIDGVLRNILPPSQVQQGPQVAVPINHQIGQPVNQIRPQRFVYASTNQRAPRTPLGFEALTAPTLGLIQVGNPTGSQNAVGVRNAVVWNNAPAVVYNQSAQTGYRISQNQPQVVQQGFVQGTPHLLTSGMQQRQLLPMFQQRLQDPLSHRQHQVTEQRSLLRPQQGNLRRAQLGNFQRSHQESHQSLRQVLPQFTQQVSQQEFLRIVQNRPAQISQQQLLQIAQKRPSHITQQEAMQIMQQRHLQVQQQGLPQINPQGSLYTAPLQITQPRHLESLRQDVLQTNLQRSKQGELQIFQQVPRPSLQRGELQISQQRPPLSSQQRPQPSPQQRLPPSPQRREIQTNRQRELQPSSQQRKFLSTETSQQAPLQKPNDSQIIQQRLPQSPQQRNIETSLQVPSPCHVNLQVTQQRPNHTNPEMSQKIAPQIVLQRSFRSIYPSLQEAIRSVAQQRDAQNSSQGSPQSLVRGLHQNGQEIHVQRLLQEPHKGIQMNPERGPIQTQPRPHQEPLQIITQSGPQMQPLQYLTQPKLQRGALQIAQRIPVKILMQSIPQQASLQIAQLMPHHGLLQIAQQQKGPILINQPLNITPQSAINHDKEHLNVLPLSKENHHQESLNAMSNATLNHLTKSLQTSTQIPKDDSSNISPINLEQESPKVTPKKPTKKRANSTKKAPMDSASPLIISSSPTSSTSSKGLPVVSATLTTHDQGKKEGNSRVSLMFHTPQGVIIRTNRGTQEQKLQFHQLPGLNFNRAPESPPQDVQNSVEPKKVAGVTKKRNIDDTVNADNCQKNFKQPARKGRAGLKRKKANAQEFSDSMDLPNAYNNDGNDAPKIPKKKAKNTLIDLTSEQSLELHGENQEPLRKQQDDGKSQEPQNTFTSSSSIITVHTPIRNLIQREINHIIKNASKTDFPIRVVEQPCHSPGVYIFDVYVLEKNNCSDYPPARLQVTEDYPGEMPVFLDFQSIINSIGNKKTREKFELSVFMFKSCVIMFRDNQVRVDKLIKYWSMSLKDALSTQKTKSYLKSLLYKNVFDGILM